MRTHIVRESNMSAMLTIIGLAMYQKNVSLCSLTTGIGSKFIPCVEVSRGKFQLLGNALLCDQWNLPKYPVKKVNGRKKHEISVS